MVGALGVLDCGAFLEKEVNVSDVCRFCGMPEKWKDSHSSATCIAQLQARIHDLEGKVLEQHGHLLNFAASVGAEDGQDMLEILYGFFARIRCECGHPADEHHMVEVAAEKQCGHSDPNHGFCECNGLRLALYSEALP